MNRRVFRDATLDAMRGIGDPALEDALEDGRQPDASYFAVVAQHGLGTALDKLDGSQTVLDVVTDDANAALTELGEYVIDPGIAIGRARDLFSYFGDEISASLLLAGLPDAYACEWGARVLIAHGDLFWALPRRVRETAMFLMSVFAKDPVDPQTQTSDGIQNLIRTCAGLRLFHHMVRSQIAGADDEVKRALGPENATPINQEDLLGTLLSFTVTTFRVLDRFGVNWSDDDCETYLLYWDLVGAALGIGTKPVSDALGKNAPDPLRPRTVDVASEVLDQLHDRQWFPVQDTIKRGAPFPWSGLAPGRMLGDALLAALTEAMPASKHAWPSLVIRELAPSVVRARLGLNGNGLTSYAAGWMAKRSSRAAFGRGATLRMMANDVTRHAMESFLRAEGPPFVVPGLDLHELTTSSAVRPTLELKPKGRPAVAP